MKVYTLDKVLVKWSPSGLSSKDHRAKSSLHEKARELLLNKYPTIPILEEVTIPIRGSSIAYLDFYIPMLKIAVEVQGEQHYKFNKHFHVTPEGFAKQRKRDREKAEWCDLNNIELILLPYNKDWEL